MSIESILERIAAALERGSVPAAAPPNCRTKTAPPAPAVGSLVLGVPPFGHSKTARWVRPVSLPSRYTVSHRVHDAHSGAHPLLRSSCRIPTHSDQGILPEHAHIPRLLLATRFPSSSCLNSSK